MEQVAVEELVNEYSGCAVPSDDPELALVETALFVEECFSLSLRDDDITAEKLGSPAAILRFLRDRKGT